MLDRLVAHLLGGEMPLSVVEMPGCRSVQHSCKYGDIFIASQIKNYLSRDLSQKRKD